MTANPAVGVRRRGDGRHPGGSAVHARRRGGADPLSGSAYGGEGGRAATLRSAYPGAPMTANPAPTGADHRRGPFREGDRVQLTDPKGRMHTITLAPGKQFHTHKGVGRARRADRPSRGDRRPVDTGRRPTSRCGRCCSDFVLSMPRGATIVYPKDAAAIVGLADVFPGRAGGRGGRRLRRADVLAAARGRRPAASCRRTSGARTSPTSRAATSSRSSASRTRRARSPSATSRRPCGRAGPRASTRGRPGRARHARAVGLRRRRRRVARARRRARRRTSPPPRSSRAPCETLRADGRWTEPDAPETLVRTWHLEGLAVRPDHRMIGHTGFLRAHPTARRRHGRCRRAAPDRPRAPTARTTNCPPTSPQVSGAQHRQPTTCMRRGPCYGSVCDARAGGYGARVACRRG